MRKPRGEVGEGGPCVSVLLFGGSGGGGKMAAHGGSAASSALKGLIQQFTAITGKRRGYRKVESGVWSGRPFRPGLPLTFMHFSLGLYPQLPSSLLRKRRRRRRVSGFRRETAPPRTPYLVLGLLTVWRETPPLPPTPPLSVETRGMGRSHPPPPARGPGGGRGGGPHPGHRPPPPSSPSLFCAALGCSASLTSFFHSSSARSFSPSPWPALPLSGPLRAIAVALACSGPPALTARLVGSAVPLPILGDRPLEGGLLRSTFKTEVLREE